MSISAGDRFGRLTVVSEGKLSGRNRYWNCICDCGNKKEICYSSLSRGSSKSCGCLNSEMARKRKTTHGKSGSLAYIVWTNMKARCLNKSHKSFHRYGGRGILVCKEWMSFDNFFSDMGEPLPFQEIDRIDNNGNYCKENCKWSTSQEQSENRITNRTFIHNGNEKTISQLSRESGINYFTLRARLVKLNWDIDRALTKKSGV